MKRSLTSAIIASILLLPLPAFSEELGFTDTEVIFGQAAALKGPASALGEGMRQGLQAAFNEINSKGGVHGRIIKLISYDDGYEPNRSITQVQKLINEDKVFGLIGAVGTPTTKATQPITTKAGIPFIGPFTGAGFLRNAAHGNIVNVRATYAAETETWINYLVDQKSLKKIAILYQDDSFGRVGLAGVNKALDKRNMSLVAKATYQRNTTAIKTALLKIRKAKPEAVVMVGAYKPIAAFIKLSRKIKFNPTFVNISFVGSKALAKEVGKDGQGVIVSQVVPFPWDNSLNIVRQYQSALKAIDSSSEPGFVTLEGYLVGRLAIEALQKSGKALDRDRFMRMFQSEATFKFEEISMKFGPSDNQGMDRVFLTEIQKDGTFKPIN